MSLRRGLAFVFILLSGVFVAGMILALWVFLFAGNWRAIAASFCLLALFGIIGWIGIQNAMPPYNGISMADDDEDAADYNAW